MSVYKNEVESRQKLLKVGDPNDIFVAFAWSRNNELRNTTMFPELLVCDTTNKITTQFVLIFRN